MRIAFYAPLKTPDHPTASGDRFIARALVEALRRGGHKVNIVSRFRSREGMGDRTRQIRIEQIGQRLAARLLRRYWGLPQAELPEAWFTYHVYHKAPDFLGPVICAELGIPYFVAEASHAPKQAIGPWAEWHAQCSDTIRYAKRIITVNSDDWACLRALLGDESRLVALPLFLDEERFARAGVGRNKVAARYGLDAEAVWVISVGMMRRGRKAACYRLLADAFRALDAGRDGKMSRDSERRRRIEWLIVGDGEARSEVEASISGLSVARLLGHLSHDALTDLYLACDLFAWPAVNEPLGLVFLEAQAAGLPVIGGRTRGVPDLVQDGVTGFLVQSEQVAPMATALGHLLGDKRRRESMGRAARNYVKRHHGMTQAVRCLASVIEAS